METHRVTCHQLLSLVFGAVVLSTAAAAEVYRWTDAKGQVHYGQRPPHGQDARRMELPAGNAAPGGEPDAAARREHRQRVLDDFEYRRQRKREEAARLEQQQAEKAAECQRLQRQWRRLTHAGPIYYRRPGGEREYIDDREREAQKDALRPRYRDACGETP